MNTLYSLSGFDDIFRLFLQVQQGTPDTSSYMIAGFAVIFGTMLVYIASLFVRWRNFQRDLEMLRELENRQPKPLTSASSSEKRPLKPFNS